MINNFINKYFFYLYVFTLCFGVLLYNTTGFKGLDVVSSVLLVVLYIIFVIGTKNRSFNIGFLVVILIFLFYLNYSFYIANNTLSAIAIDFLTQLRPYVVFFIVLQLSPTFTEKQKAMLKKICFYIWLFYIPIGLLAIENQSFLSTMMDQPSNYTACITCLAIVHLFCGSFSVKDKLTFIFMLATGLITIHSRFYIFFLVVCGILMYFHHADVLKSNLKTGFALASMTGLIIYISKSDILNYLFPAGVTGGGFASFATQASSGFFSQLNDSGFNPINGFMHQEWFTGSSSYYPFLAQLGLVGILLYLSFWVYIITISIVQFKQKGDIQPFIVVLMLAVFIFLENISDAFFTSNKGYFMMMFIGLLLGKPEDADNMVLFADKRTNKKKRVASLQAFWFLQRKRMPHTDKTHVAKEITYLIPPVPIAKKVIAEENQPVKIDENQSVPIVQPEVEIIHTVSQKKEEIVEVVNDNQDESITEMQLPNGEVIPSSEILSAEEDDDEDEWEDDFEDDGEYDWEENDTENETVSTENYIEVAAKEEPKEEAISISSPVQSNTTNTYMPPAITYTFNSSDESLPKQNAVYIAEENSDDDFADEPYNYMI